VFFTAEVRLIWVFLICAALGAVIDRLLQRRGVLPSTRRRQRKEARQRDQKAQ
jgi:heme exporter protein D